MSDQVPTKNVWPDQWFVSDGLNIEGPLSANDAFSSVEKVSEIFNAIEKSKISTQLLVSRKGFTKWYKYSELHNLYIHGRTESQSIVANLRNDIILEIDRMKTLLPTEKNSSSYGSQSLESIYASIQPEGETLMVGEASGFDSFSKPLSKPLSQSVSNPQSAQNGIPSNATPRAVDASFVNKERSFLQSEPNKGTFSFKIEEDLAGKSLDYLHIMFRGRLRMGELSSPLKVAASTLVPFQLPEWISKYYQEILWHLDDAHFKKKNVSPWLGMIPVLNVIVFYRLATAMLAAEIQNNYRSISIFTALFLSFFPPAAVYYLERAAQKHWITHLKHIQQTHGKKTKTS